MIIKFSWGTGHMEMNADYAIKDMSMTNCRKWLKLFARYGEREQHAEFISLLKTYIKEQERAVQLFATNKEKKVLKRYETILGVIERLVS